MQHEPLPPFDYEAHMALWNTYDEDNQLITHGTPSPDLGPRARQMAQLMLSALNIGLTLNDLPDTVFWDDRLWDVHDDDELFYRARSILAELLQDSHISKAEFKRLIAKLRKMEFEEGRVIEAT